MIDRKRSLIMIWTGPVLIGLVGVYRVTQSPSFPMYRVADVLQLLASGLCFGAALVGVIFRLGKARP